MQNTPSLSDGPSLAARAESRRLLIQLDETMGSGLEGYASATSVSPGETIAFHVSTQGGPPDFKIDIYRKGKEERLVHTGPGSAGPHTTPANAYEMGSISPA